MLVLIIIVIIICIIFYFPLAKTVKHSEIFKNIDPECDNYSKKECSMPGKISNKCYNSNFFTKECSGPTKIGPKCYDHHYNICISK